MEVTEHKNIKQRTFEIIQVGEKTDFISRFFDFALIFLIILNVAIMLVETYDISEQTKLIFHSLESICVVIFTIEYALRVWTSDILYPRRSKTASIIDFVKSPMGLIDLLAILPYYLPFFFPTGFMALRAIRAIRILRLFRINRYYDSLAVIGRVIKKKKGQLLSSLFIILVMMTASALIMYNVEHRAQPEKFDNAFTSIWFVVSNISTIGFGDIYPITIPGRVLSIIITFMGIGLVAIPTGIISAGFIEQVAEAKKVEEHKHKKQQDSERHFCPYCGKKLD